MDGMDRNLEDEMRLHSAGATVRHVSVFDHLETYHNNFELSKEFIDKWVLPLYLKIRNRQDHSWIDYIMQLQSEITEEVTLALLGDFNWRTRTVGAYLSAIKNYDHQIDLIGVHLLKSEVCYAGDLYAMILAYYNQPKTVEYLNQYLDYYLQKPELYFDQEAVLEAVAYLDTVNHTNNLSKHLNPWNKMLESRGKISRIRSIQIKKMIEAQEGKTKAQEYINRLDKIIINPELSMKKITEDIKLLHELKTRFD
jgi:hypothetical protein